MSDKKDNKDNYLAEALLVWAALGLFDRGDEWVVEDLYEDWYSPEEIAEELDMDEDDIREIVWEDEEKDYDY